MKFVMATIVGAMISGSVMAAHGPAGCGLGSVIFKNKKGLMWNVLASTTNGSSGNNTFGMSTGTLGCETNEMTSVAAISFIKNNRVALSNDVSRGEGQTLNAYLSLINADSADKSKIQANYGKIFAKGNSPEEIHTAMKDIVKL